MIFKFCRCLLLLTLAQTACAKSVDFCDTSDLVKVEKGWVKVYEFENVRFIEFSTDKTELEAGEPPIQSEMIATVARDAAVAGIMIAYSKLISPPSKDSDLSLSHLESFRTKCNFDFRYTFRVPVSNLKWVSPSLDSETDSMAPAKMLLKEIVND